VGSHDHGRFLEEMLIPDWSHGFISSFLRRIFNVGAWFGDGTLLKLIFCAPEIFAKSMALVIFDGPQRLLDALH
jgi:hypothetical protein